VFLERELFEQIVENTPLISIDLYVKDAHGRYLLGKRTNRPAKDYWFVPGGRIFKGESLKSAFQRLCSDELGIAVDYSHSAFVGVFEHMYEDSVFSEEKATHYIVLVHEVEHDIAIDQLPKGQHCQYRWFSQSELMQASDVHHYNKLRFFDK
jgi:colanic acid biosynthesis protein WcaH